MWSGERGGLKNLGLGRFGKREGCGSAGAGRDSGTPSRRSYSRDGIDPRWDAADVAPAGAEAVPGTKRP